MSEYRRSLDVKQGYDFNKARQPAVGFITKMKIGEKELKADQACKDPMNPTADLPVVAVLSGVLWETGVTDAVYLSGQISPTNRQEVAMLTYKELLNINAAFQFMVYEYDKVAKKYFVAFKSTDTDMNGLIEKRGEELTFRWRTTPRARSSRRRTMRFRSASSRRPPPRLSISPRRIKKTSSNPGGSRSADLGSGRVGNRSRIAARRSVAQQTERVGPRAS
ncbi:hypothetical protein WME76_24760 [Sorangium sp. So ce119]|uniref:hypothetical protein n=1 Tax=Sorangium sp. So ce119 TaxID=3133279 RepID=UPI003F64535A